MTKEEIRKILDNTKVYVNGKSREIQEKLFSFGYKWYRSNSTDVHNTEKPFLFISKRDGITHANNMTVFTEHENREITADEILSLEITEPSYRPFKSQDECWKEMLKHQPFGWLKLKKNGRYRCIGAVSGSDKSEIICIVFSTSESLLRSSGAVFDEYTFADGTPFGIECND